MPNQEVYYKKNDPVKTVTISNNDENAAFYQLSDGNMIKKTDFFKYYAKLEQQPINETKKVVEDSDYVNPETFFSSSSVVKPDDLEKIKKADPSKGALEGAQRTEVKHGSQQGIPQQQNQSAPMDEQIVRQVDPADVPIPNNTNVDTSSYKVYEDDDEAYKDLVNKAKTPPPVQQKPPQPPKDEKILEIEQLYEDEKMAYGDEEAIKRKESRLKRLNVNTSTQETVNVSKGLEQPIEPIQQMDPSQMMFKSFKRNHDIKISLEFNNKIGNPDFIKMMMENIDGDIIAFYKDIITKDIMDNFFKVEDEVEKQLKEIIFGEPKKTKRKPRKTPTKKVVEDKLIPGRVTKTGKQTYKYIDEGGKVKELLPETAEERGLKPLKTE